MPLDDTHPRTKAKPAKVAAKPDAFVEARAALDRDYLALLARAKTAEDKVSVKFWHAAAAISLDETWKKAAKKAAIDGAVVPKTPFPVGTSQMVFEGNLVKIGLKVTPQKPSTDVAAMVAYLEKHSVKPALLKRAVKLNTTIFPGAHVFTASLV